MRLSAVVSGVYPLDVDPIEARDADRTLVAVVRDRLDGITLQHRWSSQQWNLQAVSSAAYLSADAYPLRATVRGLALGVLNPVELAEQLATLDHAWEGRFDASVVVGSAQDLARHGIEADRGAARFEQSLAIMRAMWSQPVLSGTGPEFVFDEVQPTLRSRQEGGPPLSLEVSDRSAVVLAARLELGVHLPSGVAGQWADLVAAYRGDGGAGPVSLVADLADATPPFLDELVAAGVDQVDVVVRRADTTHDTLLRDIDDLAGRLRPRHGA